MRTSMIALPRIAVMSLCTGVFAVPAFAQTSVDPTGPVKPGAVRVITKAPEPDKWTAQRSPDGNVRVFKCRELACPDVTTVTIMFSKSPTRHPDPKALEKLAKVDLPKSMRALDAARGILSDGAEKVETVSSKTATLKGYPAVVSENKFSKGKTASYLDIAILFAGPMMIRLNVISQDHDFAKKTLDQFVETMKIEEGPPLEASPTPSPTPGANPAVDSKNSI
jgi:hypothetical protein